MLASWINYLRFAILCYFFLALLLLFVFFGLILFIVKSTTIAHVQYYIEHTVASHPPILNMFHMTDAVCALAWLRRCLSFCTIQFCYISIYTYLYYFRNIYFVFTNMCMCVLSSTGNSIPVLFNFKRIQSKLGDL